LLIGIEDGAALPPSGQTVPPDLLDRLRRRIGELTVNVQALPSLQRAANGAEHIELVIGRAPSVASTSDGRYLLRVGDTCKPVLGDAMCCVWPMSGRGGLGRRWIARYRVMLPTPF